MPGIIPSAEDQGREIEDDDYADDPISQMDFRGAIRHKLQQLAQQAGEQLTVELANNLSASERKVLQQVMSER